MNRRAFIASTLAAVALAQPTVALAQLEMARNNWLLACEACDKAWKAFAFNPDPEMRPLKDNPLWQEVERTGAAETATITAYRDQYRAYYGTEADTWGEICAHHGCERLE